MKAEKSGKLSAALAAVMALLFGMYLLYGLWSGGFGANSGSTMAFFAIGEAKQGMIMTVQSIGCVVLSVLIAIYGERLNKLQGLFIGLAVMGAAGLLIGTLPAYTAAGSGYALMLAYSLIGGAGYITVDLLMNGAVADVYPEKKTTILPLVHGFFALGSMLAPLYVTALANPEKPASFARPYLVLGILALAAAAIFFFVFRRATPETPYADMAPIRARAASNPAEIFRDIRAWQFLLCCFLYHSFQTGMVAWLPRFFESSFGTGYETANSMLTLYFLGALCIRFLSPFILKKISARTFYLASVGTSVVVFCLFLFVASMPIGLQRALLVLTGLMQGSAIPSLQILCTDAFPDRTASASSAVGMGISLSSLIAPLAMGLIIEKSGYAASMWFVTALLTLSVAVLLTVRKQKS